MLAREVSGAAAEREAGDTGRRDNAGRHGEPVDMRAWSTSPCVQPGPARTEQAVGLTRAPFIIDMSIISPSSTLPRPGPLCPPPRIATLRSFCLAKLTAVTTSATSVHRAIITGLLSIIPL